MQANLVTSIDSSVDSFFNPKGIAVIGVSLDPSRLGYGLARNLVESGYQGAIHFVNPKQGRLLDRPVYPDIHNVPNPVDLAVVLVPSESIKEVLEACGRRGISSVIVSSGGFGETGPTGAEREQECLQVCRSYGMRLMGPNCIGVFSANTPFNVTFLAPPGPPAGEVAFVSQSGAICAAAMDWARGMGFGFSNLVSLGNEADVSEADVLEYLADDPLTKSICLYLESVKSGAAFIQKARRAARTKPIIALKVGRSPAGRKAAASHTGALAGHESAYDAAFQRAGILRADTTQQLIDWARLLAWSPLPRGRRVAILTNAGGPGVTAADAVASCGLELAPLESHTREKLNVLLPAAAVKTNPVDMLASATPEQYAEGVRLLLADATVDSVVVLFPPPPVASVRSVVEAFVPVASASDKPVLAVPMGDEVMNEARAYLQEAHIPDFRFPEDAIGAVAALVRRADFLDRPAEKPVCYSDVACSWVETLLVNARRGENGFLSQMDAQRIIESYGIRISPLVLARTAPEAVYWAHHAGYPVALKLASLDVVHKSDVNGILLNLADRNAVVRGYEALMTGAKTKAPTAHIEGVYVQRMAAGGQDVITGLIQDPQFGPLLMFGSGGIDVEGLHDVTFALAPLSRIEAERMIDTTWAGKKLSGFRGIPAADRSAVVDTLLRLGQLGAENPSITEIEINPLRVLPDGQGAIALDVRVRLVS